MAEKKKEDKAAQMAVTRKGLILMVVGLVVTVIGFIVLSEAAARIRMCSMRRCSISGGSSRRRC